MKVCWRRLKRVLPVTLMVMLVLAVLLVQPVHAVIFTPASPSPSAVQPGESAVTVLKPVRNSSEPGTGGPRYYLGVGHGDGQALLFERHGDQWYTVWQSDDLDGEVRVIEMAQLDGEGSHELIVGVAGSDETQSPFAGAFYAYEWKDSSFQPFTAYAVNELGDHARLTEVLATDVDQKGGDELVALLDRPDEGSHQVVIFSWQNGSLNPLYQSPHWSGSAANLALHTGSSGDPSIWVGSSEGVHMLRWTWSGGVMLSGQLPGIRGHVALWPDPVQPAVRVISLVHGSRELTGYLYDQSSKQTSVEGRLTLSEPARLGPVKLAFDRSGDEEAAVILQSGELVIAGWDEGRLQKLHHNLPANQGQGEGNRLYSAAAWPGQGADWLLGFESGDWRGFVRDTGFPDLQGHWAEPVVLGLVEDDVIKGYPDNRFRPETNVSRAQAAVALLRLSPETGETALRGDDGRTSSVTDFNDLAGHWAAEQLVEAVSRGWFEGYPGGRMEPDRSLTRAELAVVLTRLVGTGGNKEEPDQEPSPPVPPSFVDTEGHWAGSQIKTAAALGLVKGYPDSSEFRPDRPVSRAELAQILQRLQDLTPTGS